MVGPRLGGRWRTVVIEVPADARYRIVVGALDDLGQTDFRLRRCGSTCFDDLGPIGEASSVLGGEDFCLAEGRYTVRLGMADGHDASYRLSFEKSVDMECG